VVLILLVLGPSPAHSQADTTQTAPDTTQRRPPPDTTTQEARAQLDPLRFAPARYGTPVLDSLPANTIHVGLEHMLAQRPGSFLYNMGAVAWPHGWSTEGLPPHRTRLWLNGHPYNDPITGRPRYDLLPTAFLASPRIGTDPGGAPVGVHATWREYPPRRPVTELRFRRDSNGLKSIETTHSQKRRIEGLGPPGQLQVSFGYGGRTTAGVYDGSDLRRERRIWGRVRYQTNDWAVELSDVSSRHRIGAHGGVEPSGPTFNSIYVLPPASDDTRMPTARRRTFRNDLTARVRGPLLPDPGMGTMGPASLSATWTAHTFAFLPGSRERGAADTMWSTRLNGGHVALQQPLRLGRHALSLEARGSLWRVADGTVPQIDGSRWNAHLALRDSVRLGALDLALDAGWHAAQRRQSPSAAAHGTYTAGPWTLSAGLTATSPPSAWMEEVGYQDFVQPPEDGPSGRGGFLVKGRAGVEASFGTVDVGVEGFAHRIRNAVDLYAAGDTTQAAQVAVRRTSSPVYRAGATLLLGWRREARRGLYLRGSATTQRTLNADASQLHTRLSRTLPLVHGSARLGARFVFFQDLVTDLFVQARGWSSMNSRWFHPPTGRFAVPPANAPIPPVPRQQLGPSGTVDVHAEARLRGATLFFTFENVQAGTGVQPGTFVVPVYPLPARQFRFGVYWPLFN
jgi:hypothetical protein